jgi:GYF domain 2
MGNAWYVARNGETFGPFSFERVIQGARTGEMQGDDLVWCDGMAGWLPAAEVPELWNALHAPLSIHAAPASRQAENARPAAEKPAARVVPPDESGKDTGETAAGQAKPARPRAGLIARHWRGELTLAQAYWGAGFLLTIVVVGLSRLLGVWLDRANLAPTPLGLVLLGHLTFLSVLVIWQIVGIWRAAGNHIRSTGRRTWAVLARVAIFAGALRGFVDFTNVTLPMMWESVTLVRGQENIPPHRVRLLRSGTEMELAGGMPHGTAEALRKALDAAPNVQVLHLNSLGGRVSEGYQIYRIVRDRQLTTYTATDCFSACTIAFLGGSQRYLANNARLGFHSISFGGLDYNQLPDINDDLRRTLEAHGVPRWFIDKAFSTPASSMWHPTHDELVAAKIVTRVVDSDQFGWSGLPDWQDADAIERGLLSLPLYRLIKNNDPEGFKNIAGRFAEAVKLGKSMPEVLQDVQALAFADILPKYLQVAPDGPIQRYWRTQTAEMEHLSRTDAAACAAFAFPELRRADYNIAKLVPAPLLAEDIAALTDLVQQAIRTPDQRRSETLDRELDDVGARLTARIPSAQEVLAEPSRYFDKPKLLCDVVIAFYADILSLPPHRSGPILRAVAEPVR